MIQINYDHVLSDKIGARNGMTARRLEANLAKNQDLVKEVFRNKNKLGYSFLTLPEDVELVRKIWTVKYVDLKKLKIK